MNNGNSVNWGELFEGSVMKYIGVSNSSQFAGDALSKRVKFYHMQADYTDDKSVKRDALLKHQMTVL